MASEAWVCGHCGAGLRDTLISVEVVIGHAAIRIDDGGVPRYDGWTDIQWDTSTTASYQCKDCLGDVTEAQRAVLERALGDVVTQATDYLGSG